LISTLRALQHSIIGILEVDENLVGKSVGGIPVIGTEEIIEKYPPDDVELVNGVGSVASLLARKQVFDRFKNKGYKFLTVIHPSAIIADDVIIGEGVQIMAGTVIQTGCQIGDNSIVNTGSVIDHDCFIDSHVHIAPGAVLSGEVHVGTMTHVGTSSAIIQGIKVGANCLIGAGSVVINDIPANSKAIGVPAKVTSKEITYHG